MAVRHGVTDTDRHFVIDPVTRVIKNNSGKLVLIQYDHNSERFTFECPRYVDNHDMSLSTKVEIHYINVGTGSASSTGIYEAEDLAVSTDDSEVVTFSWLISQNATKHVGKLNFVIRFACVSTDGEATLEYAWNTAIYSDIVISKSIYNGAEFIEEYADLIEQWKQDLYSEGLKITSVEQTTTSTEDGGTNVVSITMTDGSVNTIKIQNGSKGEQGTSISSIVRTSGNGTPGTTDTYTVTMSDGSTNSFRIYNGKDGKKGDNGRSIVSHVRALGNHAPGTFDTYRIDYNDGTSSSYEVYNGANGANGADGASIKSIDRTSGNGTPGTTDTYTITLTNGTKTTFQVYNGANGASGTGSGDMSASTYDPNGKHTDVYAYADNATAKAKTLIVTAKTGTDGLLRADYTSTQIEAHIKNGGDSCILYNNVLYPYSAVIGSSVYYTGIQLESTDNNCSFYALSVNGVGRVFVTQRSFDPSASVDKSSISDSTSSDSTTTVASSKAVKAAYDKAVEAYNKAESGGSSATPLVVTIDVQDVDGEAVGVSSHTSAEIVQHIEAGGTVYAHLPEVGILPLLVVIGEDDKRVVFGATVLVGDSASQFGIEITGSEANLLNDAVDFTQFLSTNAISDSTTSDSSSTVASSKAVKAAYDMAVEAMNGAQLEPLEPLIVTVDRMIVNNATVYVSSHVSFEIYNHICAGGTVYADFPEVGMLQLLLVNPYGDDISIIFGSTQFAIEIKGTTATPLELNVDSDKFVSTSDVIPLITETAEDDQIPTAQAVYSFVTESIAESAGFSPVTVEILEIICGDVTFNDSNPSYTLPSAKAVDNDAMYYMDCDYYEGAAGVNANEGYSIHAFSVPSDNIVRWASADATSGIQFNGTTITNNWRDPGSTTVISIYKVKINRTDKMLATAIRSDGYKAVAPGGYYAHAEGYGSVAIGYASHAEGMDTYARGKYAHVEGHYSYAIGEASHAEGIQTKAYGNGAHSEGRFTTAAGYAQHAEGAYNIEDADDVYLHIVGNGESDTKRSNAHTLDWDGNAWFAGNVRGKGLIGTEQVTVNNNTNHVSIWPNGLEGDGDGAGGSLLWIGSDGEGCFTELYIGTPGNYKNVATKDDITAAITGAIEGSY